MSSSEPAPTESYPITARTTPTRARERVSYGVDEIHAVLDEALVCHLGTVVDGEPVVLPTIHARLGEWLYLHASTGSRLARQAAADPAGVPVCLTVTVVDALVVARSQFHHSMNFRSVVVRGRAVLITDPQRRSEGLAAIVEHVVPGRSEHARPWSAKELSATAVLGIALGEASLKQRSGPPADDEDDLALPHWAGLIPVTATYGPAVAAPDLAPGIPLPDHLRDYRR